MIDFLFEKSDRKTVNYDSVIREARLVQKLLVYWRTKIIPGTIQHEIKLEKINRTDVSVKMKRKIRRKQAIMRQHLHKFSGYSSNSEDDIDS